MVSLCKYFPLDGMDFTSTSVTLTFIAGSISGSTVSTTVSIEDDNVVEGAEMFYTLGSTTDPHAQFIPGGDTATVTILDDDGKALETMLDAICNVTIYCLGLAVYVCAIIKLLKLFFSHRGYICILSVGLQCL